MTLWKALRAAFWMGLTDASAHWNSPGVGIGMMPSSAWRRHGRPGPLKGLRTGDTPSPTAQARARSTGQRHRLVDEHGQLLDLLEP